MKTEFIVTIETPDAKDLNIIEDCEKEEEDYTQEELVKYREEYADDIHAVAISFIEKQLNIIDDQDEIMELINDAELWIEGWDDVDDYGVKISVEKKKI
jgi:hypothetical protein